MAEPRVASVDENYRFPTPLELRLASEFAGLVGGKVPESQIPSRLSESGLAYAIDVRGQARHVKTFGAVGDGVVDDTVALTAAIDSDLPLYWGDHRDTYRITGMLFRRPTAPVEWSSQGATVFLDSPTIIQRAIYLELQGWSMTIDGRFNVDCQMKAHVGLSIVNNSETFVDLRLINVCVENMLRASSALTGGEAFWIRGAFTTIYMERPTAREIVMAPGAGVPGAQGVTGINITAFNYLKYPKRVTIIAPEIDGVYDQNLGSNIDQDGIKVFGPEDVVGDLTPNDASFNIIGGTVRDCGGRAVKSQMDWGSISGLKIYRGNVRAQGGPDIDFQVGGGKVADIEVQYEGNASSSIVNFSGPATTGKKITHGSVSGIKAVITGDQTPAAVVTFNQRASVKSNVIVRDVEVVGNQPSHVLTINGVSGGVHSAAISDVFAAPTECLVRGAFGSPNGWTGHLMAANCLNLGALPVPLYSSSSGSLAAPTVHNVNCVNYT